MKTTNFCINCMQEIPEGVTVCTHCGYDQRQYKPVTTALLPETILNGRYLIGRALGAGGFGITYLAMDLVLDRKVCVKEFFLQGSMYRQNTVGTAVSVMTESDASKHLYKASREKFELEAKTLAKLEHVPGIVGVQDYFNSNNTAYIVMEYLEGTTLKDFVKKQPGGKLGYQKTLDMFRPVIKSLDILHKQGILHRDISPDNIMVLRDGSMKLFDFGGARIESKSGAQSMVVFRKPGYSPVEQYGAEGQGTWSDVYALAATIYFCLTGKAPVESIRRIDPEHDPLITFKSLGIIIPEQVENAIYKGLQISRRERYQTIEEFEKGLYDTEKNTEKTGGKQVSGPGQPKGNRAGQSQIHMHSAKQKKSKRLWIIAVVLGLIVMGAILAVSGVFNQRKKSDDLETTEAVTQEKSSVEKKVETEKQTETENKRERESSEGKTVQDGEQSERVKEDSTHKAEMMSDLVAQPETETSSQGNSIPVETETEEYSESKTALFDNNKAEMPFELVTESVTKAEKETYIGSSIEKRTEASAEQKTELLTEPVAEERTENPTEPTTKEKTEAPTEPATVVEKVAPTEPVTEERTEAATELTTEEKTEAPTEPATEEKTEAPTEPATEEKTEAPTEPATKEETEAPTEPVTERQTEAPTESATEEETEAPTEPVTERQTEAPTEPATEEETEAPTEPVTERQTEAPTEPVTEERTEAPTEPVTEEKTESPTEPPTEPVNELPAEKYVGTYSVNGMDALLWSETGLYANKEEELRHVEEAEPFILSPETMIFADSAAAYNTDIWLHTDFYGVRGWIKWGAVTKYSQDDLSVRKGDEVQLAGNEGTIAVRIEADDQAPAIAQLQAGKTVRFLDFENGWARVQYDQDPGGWINMNAVHRVLVNCAYQTSDREMEYPLLTDTRADAEILTTIPSDAKVLVDVVQNGYAKTAYNGLTGWISWEDLVFAGENVSGLEVPAETASIIVGDYHDNLLKTYHGIKGDLRGYQGGEPEKERREKFFLGVDGWNRKKIQAVYVLDSLQDKPENAIDLSEAQNGSVWGWMDESMTVFIAGNGGVLAPEDCSALFAYLTGVKVIDLGGNLHTDNTKRMDFMFYRCLEMENLNLGEICTDQVEDMGSMFGICQKLSVIDLSSFNTANVTNFYSMFSWCASVEQLNLTTFNSTNVTDMAYMFYNCQSLNSLSWRPEYMSTSNTVDMTSMFNGCINLGYIDAAHFDMRNVKETDYMFSGCKNLLYLNTDQWQFYSIENHDGMFEESPFEATFGPNGEYFPPFL